MAFAVPFLLVAVPLSVENAGRWVELAVSLAVVGVAFALFDRFPVAVVSLSVAGVLVPTLVLAPTVTTPVRVWPFVAAFQILGGPEPMLPAAPQDADCRHYWATVQTDDRLLYRVCFVDGRLAVKETVPRSAVSR